MLIEALVATLIVAGGLLATLRAVDGGQHLSRTSQRHQEAVAYAQREIEQLTAIGAKDPGYSTELAMNRRPAFEADATPTERAPSTPAWYVDADALKVRKDPAMDRVTPPEGVAAGGVEPFVVASSGVVDPGPQPVAIGTGRGKVYRYVTARTEPCVELDGVGQCPGSGSKRITIAIVLDDAQADGLTKPVYVATIVSDPSPAPLGPSS
jgi:hypothetical protein